MSFTALRAVARWAISLVISASQRATSAASGSGSRPQVAQPVSVEAVAPQ
jgi:hypothetical protein